MTTKFFKGLLAAIIGLIATLLPVEGAGVAFYVVSIIGAVVVYFGQHSILKPISIFGTIDLTDIIKGVILAVGTALATYAAGAITDTAVNWNELLNVVWVALGAYLTKNLFSNADGELGVEKNKITPVN